MDEIAGLTSVERKAFLKKLLRTAGSPLSKIHLIRILISFGEDTPAYGKLARKIAIDLLSAKGSKEFEELLDVMKWVHGEFDYLSGAKTWPAWLKLSMVWALTHRIFTLFISIGAPAAWIRETFSKAPKRMPIELFKQMPSCWFDVAHSQAISREVFLLSGLSI